MAKKLIKIGNSEYPCRVTMGAMVRFEQTAGYDVKDLKSNCVSDLCLFIHCCVASACEADGVDFPLSMQQMADRLEPADMEAFYSEMNAEAEKKKHTETQAGGKGIGELLAMALGCMRMSRKDFESCTPEQFESICRAWQKERDLLQQVEWERTRMQCLCVLQPYARWELKPSDIMVFPWDLPEGAHVAESRTKLTREQELELYRKAKRNYGLRQRHK